MWTFTKVLTANVAEAPVGVKGLSSTVSAQDTSRTENTILAQFVLDQCHQSQKNTFRHTAGEKNKNTRYGSMNTA